MAIKKTHDLAVKTGSYQDSNGDTKGRYVNVGAVWEKDDGSTFFSLLRTFNPAGVPNPDNKDSVLISRFPVKPRDGQQKAPAQQQNAPAAKPANTGSGFDDMDDDIPF